MIVPCKNITMPKNFKNRFTIKALSLEDIYEVTKFGLKTNTSRLNKIKSQKPKLYSYFECYIKQISKPINSNFRKKRDFLI